MVNRTRARWNWLGSAMALAAIAPDAASQTGPSDPAGIVPGDLPGIGAAEPARSSPLADTGLTLYLEVRLNQTRLPDPAPFEWRGGRLFATVATLRGFGFRLPGRTDAETVALDALPGVQARYDASRQRVAIDAPLEQLDLPVHRLGPNQGASPPVTDHAPGVLLNYDLYAGEANGSRNLTAASELRLFGLGRSVLSNTAISRAYRDGDGWHRESVRLDTRWQLSFPEHALTLTAGDTFTGFLDWTRPVRIGGVQIGRNYALQPYRITTPLPEFLGEATVPSAVELYVNGMRQSSGDAPMGPFQLVAAPGLTGAGDARVILTDAFGRVRTLDFPFYSTQRLLARGLSDWSVGMGVVREDYGLRSHAYAGDPVASATLRHGASNRFTVEAHAEGGAGLGNAGIGGIWLLGAAGGVLNVSHARSRWRDLEGSQSTFGYGWNNRHFNLGFDTSRSHGDYRDLAALNGTPPATRIDRALAGVTLQALGNANVNYVRFDNADPTLPRARYAGVYWNRSFAGRWSASLSYNRNLDDGDDTSVYLGIAVPLGDDHQFGLSWQRDRRRDTMIADLVRPVPGDGGSGWRVQGRSGDDGSGGLAEVGWLGQHVRLNAGAARWDDFDYAYAQASGGLVWMEGGLFAARSIHDAFAVVSTSGLAGVPVMLENRVIGRTDAGGKLLVTPLNAWQRNKLSIDAMNLPAGIRVTEVDRIATPADRAGVRIGFELATVRSALLVLHDAAGRPLPLGSRARLEGSDAENIVGHDGETYLEELRERNRIQVLTPSGACSAKFAYPGGASDDGIPRIGPLVCVQDKP